MTNRNSIETDLATLVVGFSIESVDQAILERAALTAADTIGAIIGGLDDPTVQGLLTEFEQSTGTSNPIGTNIPMAPEHSAFVQGTAGTSLELDEGHQFAGGHPAIHVLPALIAAIQQNSYTSTEIQTAFIIGYEVAARVGQACAPLADGYHPHGVWGGVGAAAAISKLRQFDVATTRTAMQIAANNAQHTHFAAATEGATVRNTYAGMSNLTGYLAARVAAAGVTGTVAGIERHLSLATADGFDTTALTRSIGDPFEIERGYFKQYPACRFTHAAIDAMAAIQASNTVSIDSIEDITIETYNAAAALDSTTPSSALAARFSLPFTVAVQCVHGTVEKKAFYFDTVPDSLTSVMNIMTLAATDEFEDRAPAERGCRITVTLTDGQKLSETVSEAKGGHSNPFTAAELQTKFTNLVSPLLDEGTSARLWEVIAVDFDLHRGLTVMSSKL